MVENKPKGSLFIIGGGSRGENMIQRLIDEANVQTTGYIYILPMASELGDSAIIWSSEQFIKAGIKGVYGFNFASREDMSEARMDSVLHAALIYVSGGDQRRFMNIVAQTPLESAMKTAYQNGTIIAGTSAGAAIMSKLMITGTELRHPEYYSTFRHLEKNNIELDTGMAFLNKIIIDQHFVKRSRYNRLISALAEFPDYLGIGIDESTAILIHEDSAEVVGESQVITFRNHGNSRFNEHAKIGMSNLELNIYLPGEKFYLGADD
jgi:cyanophycinase